MNVTEHAYNRFEERLKGMCANDDITKEELKIIMENLNFILESDFDKEISYGVMLGRFSINSKSDLVTNRRSNEKYYKINTDGKCDVVEDSTGNEFWVIIRNNLLITIFLRKTMQQKTAHMPRNKGGLGVDVIVK